MERICARLFFCEPILTALERNYRELTWSTKFPPNGSTKSLQKWRVTTPALQELSLQNGFGANGPLKRGYYLQNPSGQPHFKHP